VVNGDKPSPLKRSTISTPRDGDCWRACAATRTKTYAAVGDGAPLEGTVVVYGPANRAGDDRCADELVAAGARVARAGGAVGDHWESVAALIADAPEPHVALTLPGVSGNADWLATARVPLVGDRVAAVCGVGVPAGCLPLPTLLCNRA